LGDCDHLVEFSKDRVNVEYSYGGVIIDKEFRWQHHDVFIVSFALVIYEGSGKEVGSGVGFAWDVFDFELVVL